MRAFDLTEEVRAKMDSPEFEALLTPGLLRVEKVYKQAGKDLRFVGGAVRDLVLGKKPKDIDLASDATPVQSIAMLMDKKIETIQELFDMFLVSPNELRDAIDMLDSRTGIRVILTGIQHGTITAVADGEEFEITTLRIDTEQTGRHATVQFTKSWEKDAERRDLTFNAMSLDLDGTLYDYHGGLEDLKVGKVKTVGSASDRFEEDFLRILRFFRFYGRQATPNMDRETLNAIRDKAFGLKQISGERIWMEMSKILTGDHVGDILDFMTDTDVNGYIGLPISNVTATERVAKMTDNPITVLTMLLKSESQFAAIVDHWKLSNPEKQLGYFIMQNRGTAIDSEAVARNLIISGAKPEHIAELAVVNGRSELIGRIKNMAVPEFPVSGKDLVALGMKPGPDMGKALAKMKGHWVSSLDRTPLTKEELLKLL